MDHSLAIKYRKLNQRYRHVNQKYLDDFGLYLGQPRILFALNDQPGMTQNDLVTMFYVSKESISVSVKRLESAGLLERSSCVDDRRCKKLFLTAKGTAILTDLNTTFESVNHSLFSKLEDHEKVELNRILDKMMEGLEEF